MSEIAALAECLGAALRKAGLRLVTAESCTGGWIAQAVTAVAGSSAWFDRGFVAYSNDAKQEMLGVAASLVETHGAVSEPVVAAMALGACGGRPDRAAVAVSGVAGPGGGTASKPVGTVCLSLTIAGDSPRTHTVLFDGGRDEIRRRTVCKAMADLIEALESR